MAAKYSSGAQSYPEISKQALLEMQRQVGVAKPAPDGLIYRGLMIDHLIMPNMLVIGGRESANTRWLFEAARATGRPSWQIEGVEDIPADARGFARVGISAGASTPDDAVDEVEKALLAM